jgi:hypothetical protein
MNATVASMTLERKCNTLTKNIEFHDTILEHHQRQLDVVVNNMNIRKELRTKVQDKLTDTKERLETLKRTKQ